MNDTLQLSDLWNALTPKEIEDGCRCLLDFTDNDVNKEAREEVLLALAKALRFRPVFFQRRSVAENLPFLVKKIGAIDFAEILQNLKNRVSCNTL